MSGDLRENLTDQMKISLSKGGNQAGTSVCGQLEKKKGHPPAASGLSLDRYSN